MSLFACTRLINLVAGASSYEPEELHDSISPEAQKLIQNAFKDINSERLVDYHTHIAGTGTCDSETYLNPKMQSWRHPLKRIGLSVYASAAGIKNLDNADEEWVSRLVRLIQGFKSRDIKAHGKYCILALDKYHGLDGIKNCDKTSFYVSNKYIFNTSKKYPKLFLPVVSIHPYRHRAIEELENWAKKGVKYIKWLPNAMGIDPSSPHVDPFYEKMLEYEMILLSHVGDEAAVEAGDQHLGNPLLLRKPLDKGIRVIMAHCASLGKCIDLDSPEENRVSCFDLFLRLMDKKKYEGYLFGDISAMLQYNRMPVPLSTILERQDLHHRLVNGSDYPLPAINFLIRTRQLKKDGFITKEERKHLNEIYDYNPLLFDFVLKRTVRHPVSEQKLAPSVFMANPGLEE
jgi:predicted TIM-barrel fold metal-dependent hydrolase